MNINTETIPAPPPMAEYTADFPAAMMLIPPATISRPAVSASVPDTGKYTGMDELLDGMV